jgi:isocitrate dehydrogenase (NAD+)
MAHSITLMPGDGVGPEITEATLAVIEATGLEIDWQEVQVGERAIKELGMPLPPGVFKSLAKTKCALKGPITTPIGGGFTSANVTLRKQFGLFANLRPARSLPGVKTRFGDVDLVVVRENTESLYSGVEHRVAPGVIESLKIITWEACSRIAKFAFEFAERNGRKKVTAVHKANIMKLSDGLFLEACQRVAKRHPQIEYDEVIVDALCMKLVIDPHQFDILLCENLYGDIISDLCGGLVGGLGLVPGANLGKKTAIFEPVHGSAPDIAGKGIANPTAMILAASMMLRHLGDQAAGDRVEHAVIKALSNKRAATPDVGGRGTTQSFTKAVLKALAE